MELSRCLSAQTDCFVGARRTIRRTLVCSMEGYFPVVVRTGDRSLAGVFRTGGTHVGICATLAVSTSADGGDSWTDPVEITPRWQDARNPALGVGPHGEIIVSFWMAALHGYREGESGPQWDCREAPQERFSTPALYLTSSRDNGLTWAEATPVPMETLTLASPYGRIITAHDGTMLMSVYGRAAQPVEGVRDTAVILRSSDGGHTWGDETVVGPRYNETTYAYTPDGDLLAALRTESGRIDVARSSDHGRSWSDPVPVTRDGEHPADLTVLTDGEILMTFGRRIRPYGCGALLSRDGGRTWDTEKEILLAGDGVRNTDLGYPSTVQLGNGSICTLLYYASGSALSPGPTSNWGEVSCQALHYSLADIS